MVDYNDNTVGWKTILVGCLPLTPIGLPFQCLPLCAEGWQRKDENGESKICYPASNVMLFFFPVCLAWFYPLDKKKSGANRTTMFKKNPVYYKNTKNSSVLVF